MIAQLNSRYIRTRPKKALTRLMSYALFEGRPATTKGRWLNPFVFSFLKRQLKSKRQFKPVEKPIFILGIGRSGTTILGLVLSMHRDVGFLNEPKAIWHLIHPTEDVIGSYSDADGVYRLSTEDATEKMCYQAERLFGAYLSKTSTNRVVDKYPELIFRVDFVRTLFPDARFILLVRNGWDTCRSIASWSERFGVQVNGKTHDWWGVADRKWKLIVDQLVATDEELAEFAEEIGRFERHLHRASVEWIVTMREGLSVAQNLRDSIYTIRFEELTSKPIEVLSSLCDFCALDQDRTFLDYAHHTLHPLPARDRFDLHPKIEPIFHDTMSKLEYNS